MDVVIGVFDGASTGAIIVENVFAEKKLGVHQQTLLCGRVTGTELGRFLREDESDCVAPHPDLVFKFDIKADSAWLTIAFVGHDLAVDEGGEEKVVRIIFLPLLFIGFHNGAIVYENVGNVKKEMRHECFFVR